MSKYMFTEEFVRKLEEDGCTCDLMYGYRCGIHKLVEDEIKRQRRLDKSWKDASKIYDGFVQPPDYTSDV